MEVAVESFLVVLVIMLAIAPQCSWLEARLTATDFYGR
jgi:hypothetical protein